MSRRHARNLLTVAVTSLAMIGVVRGQELDVAGDGPEVAPWRLTVLDPGVEPRRQLRYRLEAGRTDHIEIRRRDTLQLDVGDIDGDLQTMPVKRLILEMRLAGLHPDGGARFQAQHIRAEALDAPDVAPRALSITRHALPQVVGKVVTGDICSRGFVMRTTTAELEDLHAIAASEVRGIERALREIIVPLPQEAVGLGARWRVDRSEEFARFAAEVATVYYLDAFDDDSATIRSSRTHSAERQRIPQHAGAGRVALRDFVATGTGRVKVGFDRLLPLEAAFSVNVDLTTETDPPDAAPQSVRQRSMMETAVRDADPAAPRPQFRLMLLDPGEEPRRLLRYEPQAGHRETVHYTLDRMTHFAPEGRAVATPERDPPRVFTEDIEVTEALPDGATRFRGEYTAIRVLDEPGIDRGTTEFVRRDLQQLVGVVTTGTLSPRGRITGVEIEGIPPMAAGHVVGLKRIMQEFTVALPDEPVGVGARWRVESRDDADAFVIDDDLTYHLVTLDADGAELHMTGTQSAEAQTIGTPDEGVTDLRAYSGTRRATLFLQFDRLIPRHAESNNDIDITTVFEIDDHRQTLRRRMRLEAALMPAAAERERE